MRLEKYLNTILTFDNSEVQLLQGSQIFERNNMLSKIFRAVLMAKNDPAIYTDRKVTVVDNTTSHGFDTGASVTLIGKTTKTQRGARTAIYLAKNADGTQWNLSENDFAIEPETEADFLLLEAVQQDMITEIASRRSYIKNIGNGIFDPHGFRVYTIAEQISKITKDDAIADKDRAIAEIIGELLK